MEKLIEKKASFQGTLAIGPINLKCFVTEDGERYISGRSMTGAIGMKGRGQGVARLVTNSKLQPYMNHSLALALQNPVVLTGQTPRPVHGFRGEVLADLCDVILEARKDNVLNTEQDIRYAEYAETLIRGFARVGIVALIDEATGYQEIREKKALSAILEKYIRDEPKRKWTKTFPDEFWFKLVKVKGYDSYMALKRPAFVGHWVNDIIYSRLAPGIKKALQEKNPRQGTGYRKTTHHQLLTEDYGLPELKEHLNKVMLLMDVSSNAKEFDKLLNRALPKYGDTLELELDES
ncbi:P63C domain-containing protein [Pseudoalteromonas sp. Cn5-37]|uniref:P63C domain-containing protein n=1 Tax=Pseudoalteromonas sp. Cn5-37 TaxID=2908886 RepID=UPI001F17DF8F|nr:P63C domain-containing protein [Pseudoalteromonas sp. Cn5-37]MCF2916400.1 P63C domain-containing protein [Pseudoalteromonas sp. Cn5-37]